ncbi:hypothetical protein BBK14_28520 [Parafrankia soli]|uniref:Methyltransferase domain-containing protein n=1 Tax=Parafrankia soli TaxID=2599596 RepID=A0A1S1PFU5_9ACTN|nr:class I SAM-dependent methyltransferase [Parafrankia soli]OHV20146.1 hypothetical protein BBK14_28520 [Parafrankia soli]
MTATTAGQRLYERYASTHSGYGRVADTRLVFGRDITPYLPADRDTEILELGCGQGLLLAQLHRAGYRRARGVDISEEQIATARRNGVREVEHNDLRTAIQAATGELDVVIALDLLEHLSRDDLLDVLELVAAVLRPGGMFLARVPNAASPLAGNTVFGDLTHEIFFTPRSLQQALLTSGFVDVDIRGCEPIPHGLRSTARALLWKGFSGVIRLALAAETGSHRGHIVTRTMTAIAWAPGRTDTAHTPVDSSRPRTTPSSAARRLLWQGVSRMIMLTLAAEGGGRRGRIVARNILAVAHAPQ